MYQNPFIPNYPNPYFNGYNMPNFNGNMQPNMFNQQWANMEQNSAQTVTNTNKIYVSGIEGARALQLPNNCERLACDDTYNIVYDIVVDANGKRTITTLDVSIHKEQPPIDYSDFVTKDELKTFEETLEEKIMKMRTSPSTQTVSKPTTAKI